MFSKQGEIIMVSSMGSRSDVNEHAFTVAFTYDLVFVDV